MTDDMTNSIELASGKFYDPTQLIPDFKVFDIAWGLSMTCRFSGQCRRFYSVAEHCVRVAMELGERNYSQEIMLAGLLHDASEAFITDVPRPVKALLPDYMELEERVMDGILTSLHDQGVIDNADLPVHDGPVKEVDTWMLVQEAHELMPSRGEHWNFDGMKWDGNHRSLGWNSSIARTTWMDVLFTLVGCND